ncbi:MAG: hypothetical protein ACTHLO_18835 [Pseudolabrys sp.]
MSLQDILDWVFGKTPQEKGASAISVAGGAAVPGAPIAGTTEIIKGTASAFGEATKAIEGVAQAEKAGEGVVDPGKPVDEILKKSATDAGKATIGDAIKAFLKWVFGA